MGPAWDPLGFFWVVITYFFIQRVMWGFWSTTVHFGDEVGKEFLRPHGIEFFVADRERYFRQKEVIGVNQPVQPMSVFVCSMS
ncbi:hypothetical protein SAMN05216203_1594 [Marinobacter daqiaonensis]|uniref:Uncharacterized protein n=1 Tax=Marinobacter daqiaonensis TaxID=650891 RepID=A0A1I6HWD3_9GAMM|nr:hypothetical protein SAMN05216203_1594 [Marinobacter daqiaonensis]